MPVNLRFAPIRAIQSRTENVSHTVSPLEMYVAHCNDPISLAQCGMYQGLLQTG